MEVIRLPNQLTALAPDQYVVIGQESFRLAQRPASFVVLKHVRPVVKATHHRRRELPAARG
ncbi:MAG: hypothetical protein KF778_12555 [Rhodocyclaceae bacterium]|nr:hypothetical protein [Rhodocyclaceae bacterium]